MPASNYYIIIAVAAIACFIMTMWVLNDGGDRADISLFSAFIGAGIILVLGFVVRELIIRDAQEKYQVARRRIDRNIRSIPLPENGIGIGEGKLTLERNSAILREIGRKSAAAKVLGKFAEGHKEVFELCEKYMAAVEQELPNVGVGSPRLAAFRKGSNAVSEYHHYHLLQFTEIEAKFLAQEANTRANISDKLTHAQQALDIVGVALQHYPHEESLKDSHKILSELVSSIKISGFVEQAEKAVGAGHHQKAISLYMDALAELEREESPSIEQLAAAGKIGEEIERIKEIFNKL